MRLPLTSLDAPPVRWIPIASLPAALRGEIAFAGALESANNAAGALWRVSPWRFVVAGVALGSVALDRVVAAPPSLPFASPARFVLWTAAVAMTLLAAAWHRWRPRYGRERAPGQGLLLTQTAVVLVDSHAVAVLPAEHHDARPDGRWYRDLLVTDGRHGPAWDAQFEGTLRRARFDGEARRNDPWRGLDSLPARASLRAARAPMVRGVALALVGGAIAAAGVELGPVRERHRDLLQTEVRLARARHEQDPDAPRDAVEAALSMDLEREETARRRELAAMIPRVLRGAESDAREYLRRSGDLPGYAPDERVLARLDALCDARFPLAGVEASTRIFRRAQRLRCVDPGQRIWYRADARVEALGRAPRAIADADDVLARSLADRLAAAFVALDDDTGVRLAPRAEGGQVASLDYVVEYRAELSPAASAAGSTIPTAVLVRETLTLRDGALRRVDEAPLVHERRAVMRVSPPAEDGVPEAVLDMLLGDAPR